MQFSRPPLPTMRIAYYESGSGLLAVGLQEGRSRSFSVVRQGRCRRMRLGLERACCGSAAVHLPEGNFGQKLRQRAGRHVPGQGCRFTGPER